MWLAALLMLAGLGTRAQNAAIDSVKRLIQTEARAGHPLRVAQANDALGWLYQQGFGYNSHTLDAYFDAVVAYGEAGDSLGYYDMYLKIGSYYLPDAFMHASARSYISRALGYFGRSGNRLREIDARIALANIDARRMPIPAHVLPTLRAIEQMSVRANYRLAQARSLNLMASVYLQQQQYDSAYTVTRLSLALANRLQVTWLIALNHFYLGIVDQALNRPREAIHSFDRGLKLAELDRNLPMTRDITRHTAQSYAQLRDYEHAYAFMLKHLDYVNQLYHSEQIQSIRLRDLNTQIKTLAVEKQLAEEQSRHQHMLNTALVAFLIISVLGVMALVFLRRQQKLIARQQAVIAQQQIHDLELKSLRAMIEGQEGERTRIARDLHDGLGIQLSRIKLFVEAHQELLPGSVKEPLNQFLDEACTETRLISSNLRPYALSTFGLVPALEDLVQKMNLVNQTALTIEHYGPDPSLDDEASVMVYRVVQELLNNALKHASAQLITVQIMTNDETTLVSVDDDGVGGDFDQLPSRGNGIANINARIAYLGGQVMWQSKPGRGTSVMISLPTQRRTAVPPIEATVTA
ncbi:ATP-binding protein [Spirosoma luteolum]